MNSEKYIIARKSTRKGHENEVTAYVVLLPLPDGTKYNKSFPVKDYKTEGACKRDAIKERDRILGKLAANESVKAKKSIPTVDEVFEMTLVVTQSMKRFIASGLSPSMEMSKFRKSRSLMFRQP